MAFVELKDRTAPSLLDEDGAIEGILDSLKLPIFAPHKHLCETQRELLERFYHSEIPERQLMKNWGVSLSVDCADDTQKLMLSYVVNGDNTSPPCVIGYAYLGATREESFEISYEQFLENMGREHQSASNLKFELMACFNY